MASYGFSEGEARRFLAKEIRDQAASTSFYWESEETEELLDIVVDAVVKLIVANNEKISRDWAQ
jgi:hypothetical protein